VSNPDRRAASRPLDPSTCPDCHAIAGPAVLRTPSAIYFHCSRCSRLWSIQKPVDTQINESGDSDPLTS
jgi:hypothetical protein